MASIRKRVDRWQAQVLLSGQPGVARSFRRKTDAEASARQTEVTIDRSEFLFKSELPADETLGTLMKQYLIEEVPKKRGALQDTYLIRQLMRHKIGCQKRTRRHKK